MATKQKAKRSTPVSRGERKAVYVHLDVEAGQILERLAPGRSKGQLLSRLLHEHQLRREVREQTLAEMAAQ